MEKWAKMKVLLHDPISKSDKIFEVESFVTHPEFSGTSKMPGVNDLALLKLSAPVQNGNNFPCLPSNDDDLLVGANVTVTGWGVTEVVAENSTKLDLSKFLKSAFFVVISNTICEQVFDKKFNELVQKKLPGHPHVQITIGHEIICADGQALNSIACKGDSGGYFYFQLPWEYFLCLTMLVLILSC
jgi:hypothetical protein